MIYSVESVPGDELAENRSGENRGGGDRWSTGTSFIGSFRERPDEVLIVLRGDIDAAAVERLGVHIQGVLESGTWFLSLDAAAVDSYDPGLLDLLGRTQHRLGTHRGLLRVRGLHPSLLPAHPHDAHDAVNGSASRGMSYPDPQPAR